MKLSDHDLRQIDAEYLAHLSPEQLLQVSVRLLADLKEARDGANQTPHNSSRPPGSFAPWEGSASAAAAAAASSKRRRERDRAIAFGLFLLPTLPAREERAALPSRRSSPRRGENQETGRNPNAIALCSVTRRN